MNVAEAPVTETPSFAEMYRQCAPFVWRSVVRLGVRRADVEDACQEVFVVAHRKFASFHGGSPRAWLFAIAVRVSADYRKRAHVRREVAPEAPLDLVPSEGDGVEQTLDRERARRLLERLLDTLDETKRSVFILHDLEQMPMAEVAAAVECPVQTAYWRLHRAREELQAGIRRWRHKEGRS